MGMFRPAACVAVLLAMSCSPPRGGGFGGGFGDDATVSGDAATEQDGAAGDVPSVEGDATGGPDVVGAPDVVEMPDVVSAPDVVARVCAPGAARCDGAARQVCAGDGTGFVSAACPTVAHATSRCEGEGVCVQACEAGYADCDGGSGNGCETSLSDNPANCGACGRRCDAGTMCREGVCVSSCGDLTLCGGACVDLNTNASHCGRCNNACPPRPNTTPACAAGGCVTTCTGTFGDCDGSAVTGCESDLQTSAQHCGACNRACAAGQTCAAGTCTGGTTPTARSCRDLHSSSPSLPSGVYRIDPDGTGAAAPFEVYCDMTTAGGGWTLAAVITNNDAVRWGPSSTTWVTSTPLGSALDPSANADAKSPAYASVTADELMIVRGGATGTVEVRTATGCLRSRTLLAVMSVNSVYSSSCALSCATVVQTGTPWNAGTTCAGPGIRFRCREEGTTTSVGGFLVSTDDNSFISALTSTSSCTAVQMGLGASTVSNNVDFDSDPTSTVSSADRTQRVLYVR